MSFEQAQSEVARQSRSATTSALWNGSCGMGKLFEPSIALERWWRFWLSKAVMEMRQPSVSSMPHSPCSSTFARIETPSSITTHATDRADGLLPRSLSPRSTPSSLEEWWRSSKCSGRSKVRIACCKFGPPFLTETCASAWPGNLQGRRIGITWRGCSNRRRRC